MVALGDTEVPVGEVVLVDAVRRVCHADGQYCRGAIGTQSWWMSHRTVSGWALAAMVVVGLLEADVLSYNIVESKA